MGMGACHGWACMSCLIFVLYIQLCSLSMVKKRKLLNSVSDPVGTGKKSRPGAPDPKSGTNDIMPPKKRNLNWKSNNSALLHAMLTTVEKEENWVIFGGKDPADQEEADGKPGKRVCPTTHPLSSNSDMYNREVRAIVVPLPLNALQRR
jgi:hypothetical protein